MLKGKSALVTGSTSGIGLGIANRLASEGANIMLHGFGETETIETALQDLKTQYNVAVEYSGADLSNPEETQKLLVDMEKCFGGTDILVNNAGIQHVATIEEMPLEKWESIIAINLSASFHTTRSAATQMRAKGWGRIINIASAHALVASPYKSAYVASKHGIAGFTKTVALELARENITCNAVCPGYVLTDLVRGQIADTAKARGITKQQVIEDVLLAAQPTKKFVTVEEVSELVCFICSDATASITGAILPIDGGWSAQ